MGCGHRKSTHGTRKSNHETNQDPYRSKHRLPARWWTNPFECHSISDWQRLFDPLLIELSKGGSHDLSASIGVEMEWCLSGRDSQHLSGWISPVNVVDRVYGFLTHLDVPRILLRAYRIRTWRNLWSCRPCAQYTKIDGYVTMAPPVL